MSDPEGLEQGLIIKFEPDADEFHALVRTAASIMALRDRAQSPREILPERRRDVYTKEGSKTVAGAGLSVPANLAVECGKPLSIAQLKRSRQRFLTQMLDRLGTQGTRLWSSRSILVRPGRDDIPALVRGLDNVSGLYANRTMRLPVLPSAPEGEAAEDLEYPDNTWGLQAIQAPAAWGLYESWGEGVTVAVLDTGIDPNHPDLAESIVDWAEFDATGKRVKSKPHDSHWHGTHCAGTIAGQNHSGRWIGVAPNASLVACKVLDGRVGGSLVQVSRGLEWAILHPDVDVISMSLGGLTFEPEVEEIYSEQILTAIIAGRPVVCAIGNDGLGTTGAPGNDPFAFAVGATDKDDRVAGFSGGRAHAVRQSSVLPPTQLPYIFRKPEVTAPGVNVYSCLPCEEGRPRWGISSGTSMAAPHVAGALALLLCAIDLDAIPTEHRGFLAQELLAGAVDNLGEVGKDQRFGWGRIDVFRAIAEARRRDY